MIHARPMKAWLVGPANGSEGLRWLKQRLRDEGIAVHDQSVIQPGEPISQRLLEELQSSDLVLIPVTRETRMNPGVEVETAVALAARQQGGPPVVPVFFEKVNEAPYLLRQIQGIDASDPRARDDRLKMALNSIRTMDPETVGSIRLQDLTEESTRLAEYFEASQSTRRELLGSTAIALVVAGIGLAVAVIGFAKPSWEDQTEILLPAALGLLGAVVGYYFGLRGRLA